MKWLIHTADVIEWASGYTGPKYHALLSDPPYHLTPDKRGITRYNSACQQRWRYKAATAGFMGKQWDGGDIAFRTETWAALTEHLFSGAFGMAFASSRGWHRLAIAIEGYIPMPRWEIKSLSDLLGLALDTKDWSVVEQAKEWLDQQHKMEFALESAGMVIQPSIFGWVTGQSFPKSSKVDDFATWEGHRYGGQILRNALEPVIVFQKPWGNRRLDDIHTTGAGTMWVEGARVLCDDKSEFPGGVVSETESIYGSGDGLYDNRPRPVDEHPDSRWPANFVPVHHPECGEKCHPDCVVTGLGSNAQFFFQADWSLDIQEQPIAQFVTPGKYRGHKQTYNQLALCDPVRYCPKSPTSEREAGLFGSLPCIHCGGLRSKVHIRNTQSSEVVQTSAAGTRDIPTVTELHQAAKIAKREGEQPLWALKKCRRNGHPTIKPLTLTRWLATLILPPEKYAPRRLLVPFSGAASEGVGAGLAGWEEMTLVDHLEENNILAELRLQYWLGQRQLELL